MNETATVPEDEPDRSIAGEQAADRRDCPGLNEVLIVWAVFAASTATLFITYARTSPGQLYNVSHSGLVGGASRALVQLNFPVAIAALAIAFVLGERIRASSSLAQRLRQFLIAASIAGAGMCLVTAKPGAVSQDNLDARWINAIPALGVMLLAATTAILVRSSGRGRLTSFSSGDRNRIALAAVLALAALPWLFAEAGVYIGNTPILGSIFMSRQVVQGETEVAVHLGHHHGTDGFYLAATSLLLSRLLPAFKPGPVRVGFTFYLSLMLVYGLGNMANDAWTEQIWKRGWTSDSFPSVLQPQVSIAWGIVIICAVLVHILILRQAASTPAVDEMN